jgi:hypothetical protein
MEQFKEMAMSNESNQGTEGNMKSLAHEKTKVLADKHGWSLSKAEGFLDGEVFRRRAKAPPTHAQVGIDDYSLGFRAGYYERGANRLVSGARPVTGTMPARLALVQPKEIGDISLQGRVFSEQGG